ncbi:hypothetical protein [Deinococcus sp. RL]|uniref:hypothetical protein n=1 Tax=Deinococcus sp. RL TaxID=1489678 RepID=UPI0012691A34|nr:hypothetical protein [Deinococcus sp. RL]
MTISALQLALVTEAHSLGYSDAAIARHAQISLSSVKRCRVRLGLPTTSVTQQRGKLGERLVAQLAASRGLRVVWSPRHDARHDLVIQGARVDVKTALRRTDGTWRFRLPATRPSFRSQYQYRKDYAADSELLALLALYPDKRDPDVYFLDSTSAPTNVVVGRGGAYDALKNDWSVLGSRPVLAA